MRTRRSMIALMLVAAPAGAQGRAPVVSPDRVDDVPQLAYNIDKFPEVDNFAWRAFVALNWPSLTDPAHRGVQDRAKALGDPGPRVWETFKARHELFQIGPDGEPSAPPPWATYDAVNPCGPEVDGREKTLASFEPFMDFNQFGSRGATSPLVARNRTYTRYETRLNEPQYTALSAWSQGQNLPDEENPARLPTGAIAVKAAWRLLTPADTPAVRARFYVVQDANVVDVAKTIAAARVVCSKSDIALVGLHVVVRTLNRPQGVWATFEHVDNVPRTGATEPDAKDAGMPYSYFDPSKPKRLWPKLGSPGALAVSLARPPKVDPAPTQVVRQYPIHLSTIEMNRAYWAQPGIAGTVWANYMLVATQWPTRSQPVDPHNEGAFFPSARGENLVNTTMETYLQEPRSTCIHCQTSCMSCHQAFNARGYDFVGILGSFR